MKNLYQKILKKKKETSDKIYSKMRKELVGTFWTKDNLQDRLYRMECSSKSPSLKNRTEYQKLMDEKEYIRVHQNKVEQREVEEIPQLQSLTELTGGSSIEINNYFKKQTELDEASKFGTLVYLIG